LTNPPPGSGVDRERALAPPDKEKRRLDGSWVLVIAAVAWNLISLRAETLGVSYLDDSSLHEQMVRFATLQLRSGHVPLTSWFPYLGLGSPQFLHYQSLPAMITGLIGMGVGPDAAFRWTLYILLSLWPLSVYACARLFGVTRWGAAASAAMSPFLMSVTGVGYEQRAYLWIGYGVWTQLWASLTLPLAWGLSWRAIREGRNFLLAGAAISLTIALHFETGYLAVLPLLLWPFVSRREIFTRARRAAVLTCGALVASAWVIVPLLAEQTWAATNQVLSGTPLVNGYGAARVLSWLGSGQVLDARRLPVVTVFAAIGLALACARWRMDQNGRGLVVTFLGCLVLSFGRTTFGGLIDAVPGSGDLFFRRFMMGAQLAAVVLAGIGMAWCGRTAWDALQRVGSRHSTRPYAWLSSRLSMSVMAIAAVIALLVPAWRQLQSVDRDNSAAIAAQVMADKHEGAQVDRLAALVKHGGGGRVYAGMPSNWGTEFRVGAVPVFKYLERRDVDEVGYTLRTASLMTDPEFYFDEGNPTDYSLFGIRYLMLPDGRQPPVSARRVTCAGIYCLWVIPRGRYVHLGTVVGTYSANRTDVATRSLPVLHSHLSSYGAYVRVGLGSSSRTRQAVPLGADQSPPGSVITETSDLGHGTAAATVALRRPGIAVLSASFDPGWKAIVDGHPRAVFPVAPALTATTVPKGTHTVAFRYTGYSHYVALFVLGGLSLLALAALDLMRSPRRFSRRWPRRVGGPFDHRDRGECVHRHRECFAGQHVGGVVGAQVDPAQAHRHGDQRAGGDRGDPGAPGREHDA
jgi:hypothetical protein